MNLFWRSTMVWMGLFALAFVNGALREITIKKFFKIRELQARQLSCLTGIILWTCFVWIMWGFLHIQSNSEAVLVGIGWLVVTFVIETFLLNRFISRLSWKQIIQTYNIVDGEFWGLALLWIGILPIIMFQLTTILKAYHL